MAAVITDSDEELLLCPLVLAESDSMLATGWDKRPHASSSTTWRKAYELVDSDAVRSANGIIDRYADLQIGILLVSSTAGMQGVPYSANYSAAKSYVLTLGEAVHHELAGLGVRVTVLVPGATKTPMVTRFGADQTSMRRMLTPVDVSVRESLAALNADRTSRIIGRMNRAMVAVVPRTARTKMFGGMTKSMAERVRSTTGGDAGPHKLLS